MPPTICGIRGYLTGAIKINQMEQQYAESLYYSKMGVTSCFVTFGILLINHFIATKLEKYLNENQLEKVKDVIGAVYVLDIIALYISICYTSYRFSGLTVSALMAMNPEHFVRWKYGYKVLEILTDLGTHPIEKIIKLWKFMRE